MNKIFRLFRRPPGEIALLARAGLELAIVRLGLLLFPFRWFYQRPARQPAAFQRPPFPAPRIAAAVETAGRCVPGATCLVQALAGRHLLARYGYPSTLRLGVARGREKDTLLAHAWLEWQGRVLLGGDVRNYSAFPANSESLETKLHRTS